MCAHTVGGCVLNQACWKNTSVRTPMRGRFHVNRVMYASKRKVGADMRVIHSINVILL